MAILTRLAAFVALGAGVVLPVAAQDAASATCGADGTGEEGCLLQLQPCQPPRPAGWIIVGAGAGGAAVAASLADEGEDVLVLERGQSDLAVVETTTGYGMPQVWTTEAMQSFGMSDGSSGAVGHIMGGGTSINVGIWAIERPEWFREAFRGNVNLNRLYACHDNLTKEVARPHVRSEYGSAWTHALAHIGVRQPPREPSDKLRDGSFYSYNIVDTAAPGRPRRSSGYLLRERKHLPNLRVITGATVHKVLFEGKRAVGVSASGAGICGAGMAKVVALKGVILAAGAVLTPQLLQVSGVGEPALLQKLGVAPVVANPLVGKNFIDRPANPIDLLAPKSVDQYLGGTIMANFSMGVIMESAGGCAIGCQGEPASIGLGPTRLRLPWMQPLLEAAEQSLQILNNLFTQSVFLMDPKSRGSVEAVCKDVSVPPTVTPNYYSDHRDIETSRRAFRLLMEFVTSPALAKFRVEKIQLPKPDREVPDLLRCLFAGQDAELPPFISIPCLPANLSDAAIDQHLRDQVSSGFHYFGTAADGLVVDSAKHFQVLGTEGLHVLDASIFPKATRINPMASIMSLAFTVGKDLAKKH